MLIDQILEVLAENTDIDGSTAMTIHDIEYHLETGDIQGLASTLHTMLSMGMIQGQIYSNEMLFYTAFRNIEIQ